MILKELEYTQQWGHQSWLLSHLDMSNFRKNRPSHVQNLAICLKCEILNYFILFLDFYNYLIYNFVFQGNLSELEKLIFEMKHTILVFFE